MTAYNMHNGWLHIYITPLCIQDSYFAGYTAIVSILTGRGLVNSWINGASKLWTNICWGLFLLSRWCDSMHVIWICIMTILKSKREVIKVAKLKVWRTLLFNVTLRVSAILTRSNSLPLSSKPNVITHVIMRSTVGIHEGPYKNRDTCLYMHVDAWIHTQS